MLGINSIEVSKKASVNWVNRQKRLHKSMACTFFKMEIGGKSSIFDILSGLLAKLLRRSQEVGRCGDYPENRISGSISPLKLNVLRYLTSVKNYLGLAD